jgi:hypothetical protein
LGFDAIHVLLQNNFSIPIVKDSCYSSAVDAVYLSDEKFVSQNARFAFRSFSTGRNTNNQENITCDIKICLIGQCPEEIKVCPNDEGYGYEPVGNIKRFSALFVKQTVSKMNFIKFR